MRELAIVKSRVPGDSAKALPAGGALVQALRDQEFLQIARVAETSTGDRADRARRPPLTPQVVGDTLGALLKYQETSARMQAMGLEKC